MKALIFGNKTQHLLELVGFAKQLKADEVHALAVSLREEDVKEVAELGVNKIYLIEDKDVTTDDIVDKLIELSKSINPDVIGGPGTRDGYEITSRLGARLGISTVTEVVGVNVEEALTLERAAIGGRAVCIEVVKPPVTLTISLGKFKPPEEKVGAAAVEKVSVEKRGKIKIVSVEEKAKGGIDIAASPIVVGVGRGFKSKEDLELAQKLANALGGAVGCSRPIAADYGWLPEDVWIGFSGKKIRPKLYIALGISGAAEHMAGVRDANVIVAVNTDEKAPIFEQSDYGVVADLYEFIPVFLDRLKKVLSK